MFDVWQKKISLQSRVTIYKNTSSLVEFDVLNL